MLKVWPILFSFFLTLNLIACDSTDVPWLSDHPLARLLVSSEQLGGPAMGVEWHANQLIVETWGQGGFHPLQRLDPQTGEQQPIVHNGQPLRGGVPNLAPQGKWLLFTPPEGGRMVLNFATEELTPIPETLLAAGWSDSPDELLVWTEEEDAIYRYDVATATLGEPFWRGAPDQGIPFADVSGPALSPDGTMLAFNVAHPTPLANDPFQVDIYLLFRATGEIVRLTNTPDVNELNLVWSPTSHRFLFIARAQNREQDYFGYLGIGDPQARCASSTNDFRGVEDMAWSPDLRQVALAGPGGVYHLSTASLPALTEPGLLCPEE